jgi:hypothetical protein
MDDNSLKDPLQVTELRPKYSIPAVLAVVGIALWFLKFWAIAGILILFSIFLTFQTATLRLIFTDSDLDIYRNNSLIRRFPFKDWLNWQIFWQPIPILFYFKEVKSIHFIPIIFDPKVLEDCLVLHYPKKLNKKSSGDL